MSESKPKPPSVTICVGNSSSLLNIVSKAIVDHCIDLLRIGAA